MEFEKLLDTISILLHENVIAADSISCILNLIKADRFKRMDLESEYAKMLSEKKTLWKTTPSTISNA